MAVRYHSNNSSKAPLSVRSAQQANLEPVLAAAGVQLQDFASPSNSPQLKGLAIDGSPKDKFIDLFQKNAIAFFAVMIVGVALIGAPVIRNYLTDDIKLNNATLPASTTTPSLAGLNISVPSSQLTSVINATTNQSATLNLGGSSVSISPSLIKSWLQVTSSLSSSSDNIHINPLNVENSLLALTKQYEKAPVDQVTITRADGSSEVAIAGQNGATLAQPDTIDSQALQISKDLMSNKGFQLNAPLVSQPFQALTPANFNKLIVTDLNSKRMYVYQSGQLINTFLVSAGKPSTPSPVGEFHIWNKLTSQTMVGPGYVQPNVPWVNYFDHSGDAIHGVYWRPAYVFGNVNTSHGCVGVPVNVGEWIFNWAPIGTTVINTPN